VTSDFDISALTDDQLVDRLTTIVSHAAAAILKFDPAKSPRRTKNDQSPVSAADEVANAIILEELSHLLPGMPIVSEEAVCPNSNPLAFTSSFALVDPLDGTREFLAGRDEFTVNVALLVDGTPAVGVIAAPALSLIWRGAAGCGAERLCLSPGADVGEATQSTFLKTRRRLPDEGLVAAISRSHLDAETEAMLSRLPIEAKTSCGSSIKFCRIAEGSADIYPRLAPTHEWDIAAGHAIVVAAGGVVIAPDSNPLAYGRAASGFIIPAFIALGNPEMTKTILAPAALG
jgi:3'(2'), 5'-bisphosphate nucleotidase